MEALLWQSRKENIKGSAISLSPKEAEYETSPFTRLVSVAGKEKPGMSPDLKDQTLEIIFMNKWYWKG